MLRTASSKLRATWPIVRGLNAIPSAIDVGRRQRDPVVVVPRRRLDGVAFSPGRHGSYVPVGRRHFSSSSTSDEPSNIGSFNNTETTAAADGNLSVDETLNKLFAESDSSSSLDAWYAGADTAGAAAEWAPTWYNVADQAIVAVTHVHAASGLAYGWAIVATTIGLRVVLFPLMVHAQRAASRMAHVQPELQILKVRYEKLGSPTRAEQLQFSANMKALFGKYNVNPFMTLVAPLVQLPLFVGMFFGLKKMPELFPDALRDGGMFWFVDLTAPDPLLILPVVSAVTFLGLIEIGKEQMLLSSPGPQGQLILNIFRIMALVSLPFCASFEAAMLCYWSTNNVLTMGQTVLLKAPPVRKYFGIWDPPKPLPGTAPPDFVKSMSNLVKKVQGQAVTEEQIIKKHNQEVEAKHASMRLTRAARERRRTGITGTRNR